LNLLPAFPLDGGRILRSALALFLPNGAATRVVVRTGWVVGGLSLLLATSAGRLWGTATAISLLVLGLAAIVGAGAEESFQRSQAALHGIPVRAAVRQPTVILRPEQPLTPALLKSLDGLNRTAWPVVAGTQLVGLVTRRDLRAARQAPTPLTVSSIMRRNVERIDADSDLWRAQQIMFGAGQEALPVVAGDGLLGLLTAADIRAAFINPPMATPGETPQLILPDTPTL
jgi:CBS domain-containing protein